MSEDDENMVGNEDDNTAEADTQDNALMGSDEDYTLSADEFKARIAKRREKLLETTEIENPNSSDGNKENYSVDDEYSVKEGKRRTSQGEPQKSPLQ